MLAGVAKDIGPLTALPLARSSANSGSSRAETDFTGIPTEMRRGATSRWNCAGNLSRAAEVPPASGPSDFVDASRDTALTAFNRAEGVPGGVRKGAGTNPRRLRPNVASCGCRTPDANWATLNARGGMFQARAAEYAAAGRSPMWSCVWLVPGCTHIGCDFRPSIIQLDLHCASVAAVPEGVNALVGVTRSSGQAHNSAGAASDTPRPARASPRRDRPIRRPRSGAA